MKTVIRIIVFALILQGISSFWEFLDIAAFGYSQRSAADAMAAVLMTSWLDTKIWEDNR